MKLTEEQIASIKIEQGDYLFRYRTTAMINGRLEVVNMYLQSFMRYEELNKLSPSEISLLVKSYFVKIMEDTLETD